MLFQRGILLFNKLATSITKIQILHLLLLIFSLSIIIRTIAWFYFGPHLFGEYGRSDYHDLLELAHKSEWLNVFNDGRIHQPIYPLLWFPAFNSNFESLYLFTLHQFFSIGTAYFIYLTAKKIFGVYYGLIAAFFFAVNIEIIFWFSWAYADNAFYFFLSLLGLVATNLFQERKLTNYVFFVLSSFLCFLTRPEGFFVFLAAIFVLIFIYFSQKFSVKKSILIVISLIFILSSALLSSIFLHKKTQSVFLSNFHISIALYVSSKISKNSVEEQNYLYSKQLPEDIRDYKIKSRSKASMNAGPGFLALDSKDLAKYLDCNNCNNQKLESYILGSIGLKFIKENPIEWMKMYSVRLVANLFPSTASPQWSLGHQLYSFSFSFFLVIGGSLALFFQDPRRFLASALIFMAFVLIMSINLFQREIDYRVPLSIHILFGIVAPYGWFKFYEYLKKIFVHT